MVAAVVWGYGGGVAGRANTDAACRKQ